MSSEKRLSSSSADSGLSLSSYDESQCKSKKRKFKKFEEAKRYLFGQKSKMEIFVYCDALIQGDSRRIAKLVNKCHGESLRKFPESKRDEKLHDLRLHFIMLSVFFPMEYRMNIMFDLVRLPVKEANKIALEALNMAQRECEISYVLERISQMLSNALKEPIHIGSMTQNPLFQDSFSRQRTQA